MALFNENGDKINENLNILDEIADKTRERIENKKKITSFDEIKEKALKCEISNDFLFEKALKKQEMSFICEVKKASPSKGIIAEEFDYLKIAKDYESAGADAISCLTEPFYFKGEDKYLEEICQNVKIPVLRKDFVIDEYMIYEAKIMGASAILLICAILNDEDLKKYHDLAEKLGLSALVEAHTEEEVLRALKLGAKIIGVNNRNLKNFHTNLENSIKLRKLIPNNVVFVSESGIKTAEDIKKLAENNTQAVLIGEILMRCENKKEILDNLRRY